MMLPRFLFGEGDNEQVRSDGCLSFLCQPKELSDAKSNRLT